MTLEMKALEYTHLLEEVGIPRKQAETHLKILGEIIDGNLATKRDIAEVKKEIAELNVNLKREIADVNANLKREIAEVNASVQKTEYKLQAEIEKVRAEIQQSKSETIKWIIGLFLAQTGVIAGILFKFLG